MTSIAATASSQQAAGAAGAKLTSDLNAFLKMLTTQLQNQDPLKPMDATQFTQQLVSFSQVEQQIQQTSKLQQLLDRMSADSLASATGLIGHGVELSDAAAPLGPNGAHWSYNLATPASSVTLEIKDSQGRVVQTLSGDLAAGEHTLAWDGIDSRGQKAPEGVYTLVPTAKTASGADVAVATYGQAIVDSVGIEDGSPVVHIGPTSAPISSLRRIG